MKGTHIVLLVLGVAISGVITWQVLQPKPPVFVVTTKVERVPLVRSVVEGTGEIRAKEFVDIQAEVPGVIVELSVREGDTVKTGDVLLRLDATQLKADEDSAKAQAGAAEAEARSGDVGVATAEANLAAERTGLANAKLESEQSATSRERARSSFQRKKQLHEQQLIGSEEFEIAASEARLAEQRFDWSQARIVQAEANVHAADTRVDAAKAVRDASCRRLEAANAALARATDMLGKTVLKSPLTGLITKLNVEKGERAVPGIQSNPIATLMTIADMSVIEAEIRVAEADIVRVQLGNPAEVTCDATEEKKFAGVVTEIGQSPIQNASTGSGTGQNQEGKEFKVVVRLESPPPELRQGLTATADIVTATRANVLVVPFSAQTEREIELDAKGDYVRPPEPREGAVDVPLTASERMKRKAKKGVFVRRDGRAHFQLVEFGIVSEQQDFEVLRGLDEGEEVISGPSQVLRTLKEWDHVELDPKKTKQPGKG